ncbi:MAG: HEAT repeat domain-containing protein [Bryobacterales bacterium]|nr:HEAT repeat domain-containing protein [Bryobacterales bacterium]
MRRMLRGLRGHDAGIAMHVAAGEQAGHSLTGALRAALDPLAADYFAMARVAGFLSLDRRDPRAGARELLARFFRLTEKDELYLTALALENLNDRAAVPPLIEALLRDENPHRRHAAARALGWIRCPGRAAAMALAECLADAAQPQPAREEAAESLAYVGTEETIYALESVLQDPDVRLRFWAVFGLGGHGNRHSERARRALESVLEDNETPPGNWWPVGKEALAMLAGWDAPDGPWSQRMKSEAERILADKQASPDDQRWAKNHR